MDYRVNCAPRGNIKFRRATSSWMKLIKSSIRSVIPSLGIDDSSLQEDSNETPEPKKFVSNRVGHRLNFVLSIFFFCFRSLFRNSRAEQIGCQQSSDKTSVLTSQCGNMEALMSVKRLAKSKIESDVLRKNFF